MSVNILKLDEFVDELGSFTMLEPNISFPFDIKRVQYLRGVKSHGFVAHKKCRQVFIAVSGSCKIYTDSGTKVESFYLNEPNIGLDIDKLYWIEISEISSDCVLLILSSELYDETDCLRDYYTFVDYAYRDSGDSWRDEWGY